MHFRCRVWQAQILEVIRCHLLLEHPCDVYKIIRHENANLLKSPVVFLSFTKLLYVSSAASAILNSSKGDNSFRLMRERYVCSVTAWWPRIPLKKSMGSVFMLHGLVEIPAVLQK